MCQSLCIAQVITARSNVLVILTLPSFTIENVYEFCAILSGMSPLVSNPNALWHHHHGRKRRESELERPSTRIVCAMMMSNATHFTFSYPSSSSSSPYAYSTWWRTCIVQCAPWKVLFRLEIHHWNWINWIFSRLSDMPNVVEHAIDSNDQFCTCAKVLRCSSVALTWQMNLCCRRGCCWSCCVLTLPIDSNNFVLYFRGPSGVVVCAATTALAAVAATYYLSTTFRKTIEWHVHSDLHAIRTCNRVIHVFLLNLRN